MICQIRQLGRVPYTEAMTLQAELVARRKVEETSDTLLLFEHPHVYTLGRNARRPQLPADRDKLQGLGAEVHETDRGGDITYHGPGQLLGYPILDLKQHRRDVRWYMETLEEVLIRTVKDFGITAHPRDGMRGVWVGEEKLGSLGVHLSRWVTSHGFALNVNTDLTYFDHIIPCGLEGVRMTSLEKLTGGSICLENIQERVINHFAKLFSLEVRLEPSFAAQECN